MRIKYYNRDSNETKYVYLPDCVDVVEVFLPARDGLPAIAVNVNTDAVVIDNGDTSKRLGMLEFSDLVAEAEAEA